MRGWLSGYGSRLQPDYSGVRVPLPAFIKMEGKIRLASKKDLPRILELYNQDRGLLGNESNCYSLEDIEDYINNNSNIMYVFCFEEKILGACLIQVCRNYIYLHTITVDKGYQKKGIGQALMNHIEKFANENKISMIEAYTGKENHKMHSLFDKKGYKKGDEFLYYSKSL